MKFLLLFVCLLPAGAESLHYVVNWPSGLTLGEVGVSSAFSTGESGADKQNGWTFSLDIDASVPGFALRDQYGSSANGGLCSIEVTKKYEHGSRKNDETIAIDQVNHTATRTGRGSAPGPSYPVATCARDPLAFLQFVRNELAQGRLPASEAVVFGSIYNVHLVNTGVEQVKIGGKAVTADHVTATVKGPASDITAEILFAQDQARTPVLVRIPLALGAFTVELTR